MCVARPAWEGKGAVNIPKWRAGWPLLLPPWHLMLIIIRTCSDHGWMDFPDEDSSQGKKVPDWTGADFGGFKTRHTSHTRMISSLELILQFRNIYMYLFNSTTTSAGSQTESTCSSKKKKSPPFMAGSDFQMYNTIRTPFLRPLGSLPLILNTERIPCHTEHQQREEKQNYYDPAADFSSIDLVVYPCQTINSNRSPPRPPVNNQVPEFRL